MRFFNFFFFSCISTIVYYWASPAGCVLVSKRKASSHFFSTGALPRTLSVCAEISADVAGDERAKRFTYNLSRLPVGGL